MNAAKRIESNDDLLTELLLQLPPKSVFKFISVSKRWKTIINDPFFIENYSKRRSSGDGRLLALFQTKFTPPTIPGDPIQMNILPIHPCNITFDHVPKEGLGTFVNSSNGLILCGLLQLVGKHMVTMYTVLNPVTGKCVALPRPPTIWRDELYLSSFDAIMCEENKTALEPNYIVVRVRELWGKVMKIETFSSVTGMWATSSLKATGSITESPYEPLYMPPVVVNGVFHWLTASFELAVYDPNKYKKHLQLIKAPYTSGGNCTSVIVTRSPFPDDVLLYGAIDSPWLKFWMLEKGGGDNGSYKRDTTIRRREWVLMHDIRVECLYKGIDMSKKCLFLDVFMGCADVGFDGVVSRDPLVVLLKKGETWFLYNFESKTSRLAPYRGCLRNSSGNCGNLRPFLESWFLSSYAL
ncbi:PREDICTED: F-box protein At5g03970-like [Erythranthe guttata]|nr:PREDICTED: F-box protein At5g03970-like [Erythranthe guttata]|eukprot:XP_012834651.1 PREDICTED: F-box protein At5g03970-like [Erythranthe guttata]